MNFNFISSNLSISDKNILGQIRQYRVKNPLIRNEPLEELQEEACIRMYQDYD